MKVLLAVDSVNTLNILLDEMSTRSWPTGTEAQVVSIVEDGEVSQESWREEGYGKRAVWREMERRGEQITGLSVERLRNIGVKAEVVVARGDARHLIPYYARKWSSDLIFVRAHVRKDFTHWMLGSVARAVVTSAPCTVQIVRDTTEDRARTVDGARKVLLATDGSETSAHAARATAARPWPEGSEFRVISVEEPWAIKSSRLRQDKTPQEAVRISEQLLASAGLF